MTQMKRKKRDFGVGLGCGVWRTPHALLPTLHFLRNVKYRFTRYAFSLRNSLLKNPVPVFPQLSTINLNYKLT